MYRMRFRLAVYLVNPQNAEGAFVAADPPLFAIGDVVTPPDEAPISVVLGIKKAASVAIDFVGKFQGSLLTNARASVFGLPVGEPEAGAPAIPGGLLVEKEYVRIDTPSPALVAALRLANRKPAEAGPGVYVPVDANPEVPGAGQANPEVPEEE